MVDWLARKNESDLVVRYSCGCQPQHSVHTSDDKTHEFCQFGSATFVKGVRTLLSRHVVVDPIRMSNEEEILGEEDITHALVRMYVDE